MSKLIIDYDLSVQPAMDRDMRIRDTAPEMLELLLDVRQYVADANLRSSGYAEIDLKAIDALLAKIEGGGDAE